jgi:LPS export ABC transporter protein LptC
MRSAAKRRRELKRRIVTIASSVAGLALLYGLLSSRDEPDTELGKEAEHRGYYVNDATLTEMGKDGRPRVIVHAATIEQQLSDQSVRMSQLELDYRTMESGDWHVTAREGEMPADRKSIRLAGDVAITGTESRGEALIRTERLSYDIDNAIVQTEEPVSVRFGQHLLKARGLRAELNAGTIKLESDVNGRFDP